MNISRAEQRTPHVFAKGGRTVHQRDHRGRIAAIIRHTRQGLVLTDRALPIFRKQKSKRPIASRNGQPHTILR